MLLNYDIYELVWFLERAEAGPILSLLRLLLFLRLHSTYIASIAASRFFTQINQFRLLSYFCVSVPYTIGCTWILLVRTWDTLSPYCTPIT